VNRRSQHGAMAVEIVLLTPVLVGCILTIAGGARYVDARNQVDSAAPIAARAASLTTGPEAAADAGRAAAHDALAQRGRACIALDIQVDTTDFQPGGTIEATVTCTADLSDVVGYGLPGSRRFTATATVPIEFHRTAP
jgi:Flp pilus assembly protein TadG